MFSHCSRRQDNRECTLLTVIMSDNIFHFETAMLLWRGQKLPAGVVFCATANTDSTSSPSYIDLWQVFIICEHRTTFT